MIIQAWGIDISFFTEPALNPVVLVLGAFVVAIHHQLVPAEEGYMRKAFGEDYPAYCRRVRRCA